MSAVYVLSDGVAVKIGIAIRPLHRLRALQTGHARRLAMEFILDTTAPREVERRAHALLCEYRLSGEWFAVSAQTAIDAVLRAFIANAQAGYAPFGVRDLLALWGPTGAHAALAADLGIAEHQPRDWARRGRIPSEFLHGLIASAQRRGLSSVTPEFVLEILSKPATQRK
jgi:hypothetical protein